MNGESGGAFALASKLLHPRPKAMGVEQQSNALSGCDFIESEESTHHTPCDVASNQRFLNCGNHTECDWYYKITASERATLTRLCSRYKSETPSLGARGAGTKMWYLSTGCLPLVNGLNH